MSVRSELYEERAIALLAKEINCDSSCCFFISCYMYICTSILHTQASAWHIPVCLVA